MWWWWLVAAWGATAVPLCPTPGPCPEECECSPLPDSCLYVVDCAEANLTSQPDFPQPVHTLYLDDNELDTLGPLPSSIKVLTAARNVLENISLEGLPELVQVDLSDNLIGAFIPGAFNESLLIKLELQNNLLDEVEGMFLDQNSLQYLDIRNCGLTTMGEEFFHGTPNLQTLDISNNPLENIAAGVFLLKELKVLRLNECNLTIIDRGAFSDLQDLERLELARNSLAKADWKSLLGSLPALQYLDLTASGITNLPDDVFEANSNLSNLILAGNQLSDMDVATTLGRNLRNLHFLDLSDCRLTGPLSDAFAFANLTTLILSGNGLKANDLARALSPLTGLRKLSLRNCSLAGLPNDTFHRFPEMHELDISHNPLSYAFTSYLAPLKSLQHLDLSHSNLRHINTSTFTEMTSLKRLVLSGNPLGSIDPGLFANLTHLKVLELVSCGLTNLQSSFQEDVTYTELEELYLSHNPIVVPEKGSFLPKQLNLHTLDLSYCNLSELSPGALKQFPELTWLSLAGNRLVETSLGFLVDLPKLNSLDLRNNRLKQITPDSLKYNKAMQVIRLSGNPWRCGCYVKQMWEWSRAALSESRVGALRRAVLTCQFHWAGPPGRRPSSGTVTWSRFARDPEACAALRPRRAAHSRSSSPGRLLVPALISALLVLCLATIIYKLKKRFSHVQVI